MRLTLRAKKYPMPRKEPRKMRSQARRRFKNGRKRRKSARKLTLRQRESGTPSTTTLSSSGRARTPLKSLQLDSSRMVLLKMLQILVCRRLSSKARHCARLKVRSVIKRAAGSTSTSLCHVKMKLLQALTLRRPRKPPQKERLRTLMTSRSQRMDVHGST